MQLNLNLNLSVFTTVAASDYNIFFFLGGGRSADYCVHCLLAREQNCSRVCASTCCSFSWFQSTTARTKKEFLNRSVLAAGTKKEFRNRSVFGCWDKEGVL